MAGERDLGLQALQRGDVNGAIPQLEAACAADPKDYLAHIYLGAAYSQVNRTMDAIHVLTKSVELQPANAQARYNLGIAMERAGYPEQASTAFEQALQLQADYPKAREALQRMRSSAGIHSQSSPVAPQPTYAPPAQVQYGAPQYDVTVPQQPQPGQPVYGQGTQVGHASAPGYLGGPPPAYPPAASAGLGDFGTAPRTPGAAPLYGAPQSGPYSAPIAPAPYGAPSTGPYSAGATPAPYGAQRPHSAYSPSPVSQAGSFGGIGMALLFGLIGGVIGTAIWVGIILATHYSTGLVGLGVGAIVGLLIKKGMGGPSSAGGIMASVITILASITGNVIGAAILQATTTGLPGIGFSIAGIFIAYRIASS